MVKPLLKLLPFYLTLFYPCNYTEHQTTLFYILRMKLIFDDSKKFQGHLFMEIMTSQKHAWEDTKWA